MYAFAKSQSFDSRSHSTFSHSIDFNGVSLLSARYVLRALKNMKDLIIVLKVLHVQLYKAGYIITD